MTISERQNLKKTLRYAFAAVALLAFGAMPQFALAQQRIDQDGPGQWQRQAPWQEASAHDAVMHTLGRLRGSKAYYDAMEALADELEERDAISEEIEDHYDRMARRSAAGGIYPDRRDFHDEVMVALRWARGTEAYYAALEAASDELARDDLIPDSLEDFFDRAQERAD